jgi:exopolyphosphatase / guanosine-5'-triphosphate,3'-diphosphate pyrophosphatase
MPIIAAVDAGSNAIRMVVGELDDSWNVSPLENIRLPVRLGADVFGKGYLEERTIRQAEEAFLHFKRVAENYNVQHLRAIATSAAREAKNGTELLDRIASASGIELKLINGEEEARFIHQAVMHALDLKNRRTLLIDIGGGSVEVTTSTGQNIISTDSYHLGTVRLLEKLDGKGITPETFSKLVQEYADAARYRIEKDIGRGKIQVCVGTGGNVEEIGRLRQKFFKGENDRFVTLEELKELIRRLSSLSYKERIQKWKLRPDRADVILPASIVLYTIAREAGVRQVLIPNVGLKDGILLEIAAELSQRPQPQRKVQAWHSALHLGRKYKFDERHAQLTARLACRLFEQSRSLHHLSDEYLLPFEIASLLHDIGIFINAVDHEKHGFYLLTANRLIGLTDREQNIVANVVRYHRKEVPSTGDEYLKCLSRQDREAVTKLSALLRLADSSDISRDHLVSDVSLSEHGTVWQIHVSGRPDMMLPNWALGKRKQLFEQVFGVSLQIH